MPSARTLTTLQDRLCAELVDNPGETSTDGRHAEAIRFDLCRFYGARIPEGTLPSYVAVALVRPWLSRNLVGLPKAAAQNPTGTPFHLDALDEIGLYSPASFSCLFWNVGTDDYTAHVQFFRNREIRDANALATERRRATEALITMSSKLPGVEFYWPEASDRLQLIQAGEVETIRKPYRIG